MYFLLKPLNNKTFFFSFFLMKRHFPKEQYHYPLLFCFYKHVCLLPFELIVPKSWICFNDSSCCWSILSVSCSAKGAWLPLPGIDKHNYFVYHHHHHHHHINSEMNATSSISNFLGHNDNPCQIVLTKYVKIYNYKQSIK